MAVQAHAGLETNGITGPQARPAHFAVVYGQGFGDGRGEFGRVAGLWGNRDFEAIFAGVPCATYQERWRVHAGLGKGELEPATRAKVQRVQGRVETLVLGVVEDQGLQHRRGFGTLKSYEGMVVEDVPDDLLGGVRGRDGFGFEEGVHLGLDEGQVGLAAAGVGHKVEAILADAGDDGVVDNAAGLVEQDREGRVVLFDLVNGGGRDGHEKFLGQVAGQLVLDHVAHVEEGGVRSCPQVRVTVGLVGVLDGHGEVGVRDHFGAEGFVQCIQRGVFEWC